MTISEIQVDHFDGHRNLTQGQKRNGGPTLAEALGAATKAPTLTPGAEAANVIAVAFDSGVESADQFIAEVYDANTEVNDAAFTVAETGDGAEVSPTGKARLIFTASASGLAELSVTDVSGVSTDTVYLSIRPLSASGSAALQPAPVAVALTFA